MNAEQQRFKIAELCGWHNLGFVKYMGASMLCGIHDDVGLDERNSPDGKGNWLASVPNYIYSLEAMADAENLPSLDQDKYSKWLWVVVTGTPIPVQDPWDVINENAFPQFDLYSAAPFRSATAAQRAKAFLLTFDPSLTFC